ncbi:MAG: hypothetical protein NTU47_04145 [Ignavibacteriales bacterium]|nr:hypothetical protein [Ignavibacteriales bacterium]
MNQFTSCQSKAISLSQILTSSSIQLPVYTRFQKTDLYLTVPVTSIEVSDSGIIVHTSNDSPSQIAWAELLDIITFVDDKGKPVFLNEHPDGGDIIEEIRADEEKEIQEQITYRLKHQHEYIKMEDARETLRRPWEVGSSSVEQPVEVILPAEDESVSLKLIVFNTGTKKTWGNAEYAESPQLRAPRLRNHKSNLIYREQ